MVLRQNKEDRSGKEIALPENEHGAFLIRDSESRGMIIHCLFETRYVSHYRIRQLDDGISKHHTGTFQRIVGAIYNMKLFMIGGFFHCQKNNVQNSPRACWSLLKGRRWFVVSTWESHAFKWKSLWRRGLSHNTRDQWEMTEPHSSLWENLVMDSLERFGRSLETIHSSRRQNP